MYSVIQTYDIEIQEGKLRMNNYMYLVPVAAVIALLFAAYLAAKD